MTIVGAAVRALMGLAFAILSTQGRASDDRAPDVPSDGIAQAAPESLDFGDSLISREEWQQRVDRARQRAVQARREWRLRAGDRPEGPVLLDNGAVERVLRDETLQPGDIVATDKGLLIFRGWKGLDGEAGQFVPIPPP